VFNRLIAPRSKLQVYHWARRQAIPEVYPHEVPLQNYYRALDYLMAHKESLEKNIFWKVNDLFNIDLSLVFYDLTSSYFEGSHCEIAKSGHSRDHRPDCRQIEVALLVNRNGIPIAHEVWEGNIKDSQTVADALERLKKEFNIRRCVFVGDNGLVTPDNLELLNNYGYEYILSLKLRKDPRASAILDCLSVEDYRHFEKVKDNLFFKELSPAATGERIVACYNPVRAKSSRSKRKQRLRESLDYLESFKLPRKRGQHRDPEKIHHQIERWLRQKGTFQFFNYHYHKEGDFEYHLREDVLAREEKCDGLCLLLAKSSELSAKDIATGYRTLAEIEDAFREIKSFLRIRPIYHYRELRVRGHVFICVLAYLLEKFLDRELVKHSMEFSAKAALDTLTPLHVVTYQVMGHEVTKICKPDKEQKLLLKALGIKEVPKIYPFPIQKIRNQANVV
ncbi:MAG: IS1634 family transposase, partial [bacterium]